MIGSIESLLYWIAAGTFVLIYVPLRLVVIGGSRIFTLALSALIVALFIVLFFFGLAQGEPSTMTMVLVAFVLFAIICIRPDYKAFVRETRA